MFGVYDEVYVPENSFEEAVCGEYGESAFQWIKHDFILGDAPFGELAEIIGRSGADLIIDYRNRRRKEQK